MKKIIFIVSFIFFPFSVHAQIIDLASLKEALKGSIMALDKTKVLNFFDELRKNVQSDNKHLIEFINASRYLFLAVKDRKSDNELKRAKNGFRFCSFLFLADKLLLHLSCKLL